MERPTFVIGHNNADCDSICAAISYANYKKELGFNVIPCRLSSVNSETKYVLQRFGFEQPTLVLSAKCNLSEIEMDEANVIDKHRTIKEALDLISSKKNKGLFVANKKNQLLGIVSISDLTSVWTVDEKKLIALMKNCNLEDIIRTLHGEILNDGQFKSNGEVYLIMSSQDSIVPSKDSIAIVPNNPDVQRHMIECGVSLLIIVGENWIDNVTRQKALDNHVCVIYTPLSALTCSQLIYQSPTIETIMSKNVVSFSSLDSVDDASRKISQTRFRTYPVLNEHGEIIGAVSRYHLFNYQKKKYILVDHNEPSQSINDIEYGEIVEILDHHRLGNLETKNPIEITSSIVGSSCTIIANKYIQNNVPITANIAGIMLGAIISDTLCLKSPTTTPLDIQMAQTLSEIAGCGISELSKDMILHSDSITKKTNVELLYDDFKEFRIQNNVIGISQLSCKNKDEYMDVKYGLLKYMDEVCVTQKYDLILVLFTDPLGSGSYFLYTGNKSWIIKEGFSDILQGEFAPNLISRKKQVLPCIIDTIVK